MSEQGIDWDGDVCEMCGGGGEISASDIIDNGNNVGCPACISLDCESLRVSLQCKTLAIESLQQTVAELRSYQERLCEELKALARNYISATSELCRLVGGLRAERERLKLMLRNRDAMFMEKHGVGYRVSLCFLRGEDASAIIEEFAAIASPPAAEEAPK